MKENQIVVYENGEVEIEVQLEEDSIFITQKQLAMLFDVETNTINYHIKNVFKQNELEKNQLFEKFEQFKKKATGKSQEMSNTIILHLKSLHKKYPNN